MKKYLLIFAVLLSATLANAQTNKEEVDLLQAAFGMDKKAAVKEFIVLKEVQKEPFWKLYDEYEAKRKELGKKRVELLHEYARDYKHMTNEKATAWTKEVMDLQSQTDKLINTYYKKILKVTDGIVATQFYQFENYVLITIRSQVLSEIPFITK